MSEESKEVRWLCVRCARKEGIETEDGPDFLRACSSCGIENYTRPVGVVGEVGESIPEILIKVDGKIIDKALELGVSPDVYMKDKEVRRLVVEKVAEDSAKRWEQVIPDEEGFVKVEVPEADDAESIPKGVSDTAHAMNLVAGIDPAKPDNEVVVFEVPEADDADAAEAAPSGAEPEILEEAPVEVEEEVKIKVTVDTTEAVEAIEELENTTESTIEQLKAQIADMEAKIAAKKEAENET